MEVYPIENTWCGTSFIWAQVARLPEPQAGGAACVLARECRPGGIRGGSWRGACGVRANAVDRPADGHGARRDVARLGEVPAVRERALVRAVEVAYRVRGLYAGGRAIDLIA